MFEYTSVQHASSLDLKASTEGDPATKAGNLFQGSTIHTEKAAFLRFKPKLCDVTLKYVLEAAVSIIIRSHQQALSNLTNE